MHMAKKTIKLARKGAYDAVLPSTRGGPVFCAHAYPTKISPESIALMIASNTRPGDTVFDGFGGSGTTAVAALLCSCPTDEMKRMAKAMGLAAQWGPREAIVCELSGLGSFIAETLCSRPDPSTFCQRAERILDECERRLGWIYAIEGPDGSDGALRHAVWSDVLRCPSCRREASFWDACVTLRPAHISEVFRCPRCGERAPEADVSRVASETMDDILWRPVRHRKRRMAHVFGKTGKRMWGRVPLPSDLELLKRIQEAEISPAFPVMEMMGRGGMAWGDLYRSGYHAGITHVHHFYTRRNLLALSSINALVQNEPPAVRNILAFWLSSYNASHSTLMTRIVVKKNQRDFVVTGNQPGVLYISGLPVEKNVFLGLRRKIGVIGRAFAALQNTQGRAVVNRSSSLHTNIRSGSVDYIFTDPPFGGNIPYSEANFISEAWLGRVTETADEAIISPAQKKGLAEYGDMLTRAFGEMYRILKPTGKVSVVFHSTQAAVWEAMVNAFRSSGFALETSNVLDKQQGSFKQVTTENAAKGDPLLLLRKGRAQTPGNGDGPLGVMLSVVRRAFDEGGAEERCVKRLYSRFVNQYLSADTTPPWGATVFYRELRQRFMRHGKLTLQD